VKRALVAVLLPWLAAAQPATVLYQGFLTDADFVAVDGPVEIDFRLYTVPTGGTPIWTQNLPSVTAADGFFVAELGMAPSDLSQDDLYLAVEVESSGDELMPRQPIASAPWALRCGDTELLGGQAASTIQRRVTGTCAANEVVRAINADGSVACEVDDTGTGAVTGVAAGIGLSATGTASVTVDINAGTGLIAGPDDVGLDFTGSSGTSMSASRADHAHSQYVPSGGSLLCGPGEKMTELDPAGNIFCGIDQSTVYGTGPSGSLLLVGGSAFQLAPAINVSQLSASGYFLPTPKAYVYTVQASAFQPDQSNSGFWQADSQRGFMTTSWNDFLEAELDLPQGAQVTQLDIVFENGPSGQLQCWLHSIDLATGFADTYGTGQAPQGTAGISVHSAIPFPLPPPVDNTTKAYIAECYMYQDALPADTFLYAVRVRYTLQELVR